MFIKIISSRAFPLAQVSRRYRIFGLVNNGILIFLSPPRRIIDRTRHTIRQDNVGKKKKTHDTQFSSNSCIRSTLFILFPSTPSTSHNRNHFRRQFRTTMDNFFYRDLTFVAVGEKKLSGLFFVSFFTLGFFSPTHPNYHFRSASGRIKSSLISYVFIVKIIRALIDGLRRRKSFEKLPVIRRSLKRDISITKIYY